MSTSSNPPRSLVVRTLRVRYLVLLDALLICLAVAFAFLARIEDPALVWDYWQEGGWVLLVLALAVRLPLYIHQNLYNRLWRYASTSEINGILQASLIAPLIIGLLNFGLFPVLGLPYSYSRSIFFLEAVFSFLMLVGLRMGLRLIQQYRLQSRVPKSPVSAERALIIGAGDAGAMILREIQRNGSLPVQVVGFLDDDINKHGKAMLGVPVLGSHRLLPDLVREHEIRQVIIAMPTAPGKVIRHIVQLCEGVNIRPRIVPRLDAMVNGSVGLNQLRTVEIDDLLRREPIATDIGAVRTMLTHKRVLITGGGGSIGRELCRQILSCRPAELIILGHGENSVFEIEQELQQLQKQGQSAGQSEVKISACIADTRMGDRILQAFQQYRPEVVFHAAAHKHVPLMEANPVEAVTNNILGTRNVLRAAEECQVAHFIMVSTDKAVNPTSIMGASKRAAELLVLETARRTGMAYVTVRFGNVLGSRGSVVLTFKRQIAMGGPVTITDPEVRRFFMTIPEAVQLLLQAAVLGQGGEVFMLDMGEPVRIVDLATDLIHLSGLEVERDIDIVYLGLRPGEKLYEDLFLAGETYHTTAHPKIRIAANAGNFVPTYLTNTIECLEEAAMHGDDKAIRTYLCTLVPEYKPATTTETTTSTATSTATVPVPANLPVQESAKAMHLIPASNSITATGSAD